MAGRCHRPGPAGHAAGAADCSDRGPRLAEGRSAAPERPATRSPVAHCRSDPADSCGPADRGPRIPRSPCTSFLDALPARSVLGVLHLDAPRLERDPKLVRALVVAGLAGREALVE